ncbi:MAG: hypothetical protein ABI151_06220, partial [Chitinophagaceae bacterium]
VSYEFEKAGDNQLITGKGYRNTIVPADITRPGITDINSVELNKVFSGFTDKGVVLTVITDCCHSATNTRGNTAFEVDSSREVKASAGIRTMVAGTTAGITRQLDQSGALTIGACQDNEISSEAQVRPKLFYGAFTISLCRSVTEWSQAPVDVLMERTFSKLRLLNKKQTPNIEGAKRIRMNLVGTARAQPRRTNFSLNCISCSGTGKPVIAAGFPDDLSNNDILVDLKTKDSVMVSNVGLTETEVTLINRNKGWKVADLMTLNFQVLRKLPNPDPPLTVYLGNTISDEQNETIIKNASQVMQQKSAAFSWTNPSRDQAPSAIIFYTNGWKMNRNKITETVALNDLNNTEINKLLATAKLSNVYLQLPIPKKLFDQLTEKLNAGRNRNILVVQSALNADFILAGHINPETGKIAYGWEKTVQGSNSGDFKKSSLPNLTDFFPTTNADNYPLDSLTERLNRLSVLATWLSMRSPPADRSMIYPYHLAVRNLATKQSADDNKAGSSGTEDKLEIGIERDAGSKATADSIASRFIYVMSMDPKGNTYLLYPQPRSSILSYPNTILHDTSFYHLATVRHTTPGIYHYFFIVLREGVTNRDIFTRRGVVRGDSPEFSDNPLEALLNPEGSGQRGDIKSFDHWVLKTVDINTKKK